MHVLVAQGFEVVHHPPHQLVVLLRVNVAVTLLPAMSVTINVYVPLVEIIDPLVNGDPLSVAVSHVRLSLNVTVTSFVYVAPLVIPKYCGEILSIRVTVVTVSPVFPPQS